MPLTNKESADLIGGMLLDLAKDLNDAAAGRGKRLVAVTTEELGTQIIEVDATKGDKS